MDIIEPFPTVDKVDGHLLQRFDELVQSANPEDLSRLMDSWAKYLASRRNNDILTEMSAEEKAEKETTAILEGLVK